MISPDAARGRTKTQCTLTGNARARSRLYEMEIVRGKLRDRCIMQRNGVGRIDGDCHIGSDLSGVGKHVGNTCKNIVA